MKRMEFLGGGEPILLNWVSKVVISIKLVANVL